MALIKCPECGNSVSDKAAQCIHCGYPLNESTLNNKQYCIILLETRQSKSEIVQYLMNNFGMTLSDGVEIFNNLPYMIIKEATFDESKEISDKITSLGGVVQVKEYDPFIDGNTTRVYTDELRCPRCGSTQVSVGTRGFSIWSGFIGSGKTTNRCGNCGYSWKP